MILFSIIIPVYNRPDEIYALLQSLTAQTDKYFEVILVEDGSQINCSDVVPQFLSSLDLYYHSKPNSGPGLSRNFGAERSKGGDLIFFVSDCIVPPGYMAAVRVKLTNYYSDVFAGPDRADASFTPIQKAINYSMTSFFTTGGIRGSKKGMEKFHPRSFNMGFSKTVFKNTGGFSAMRFGEDVDLSIRIFQAGFEVHLIEEAFVYHKRRTNFRQFFKQVYNSGIARINLYKLHPHSLKLVHFLPAAFTIGVLLLVVFTFFDILFLIPLFIYIVLIFTASLLEYQDPKVAALSILASFTQLTGYGTGFLAGIWHGLIRKRKDYKAFTKTFYK